MIFSIRCRQTACAFVRCICLCTNHVSFVEVEFFEFFFYYEFSEQMVPTLKALWQKIQKRKKNIRTKNKRKENRHQITIGHIKNV